MGVGAQPREVWGHSLGGSGGTAYLGLGSQPQYHIPSRTLLCCQFVQQHTPRQQNPHGKSQRPSIRQFAANPYSGAVSCSVKIA